jgi:pyruvate dehydrogenase E2 component (dihydrolipoamide acetyltransferase)
MEAGTIGSWAVKVGDKFVAGDVICSIETDKATMDFEAQDEGVVAKILVDAGSNEIKCGTPIMISVEDGDNVGAFANWSEGADGAATPAPAPAAAPTPAPAPVAAPTPAPVTATPAAVVPAGGRVKASPKAHMIAKALGKDISAIVGTGPGGRILAADVQEFVPAEISVGAPAVAAAPVAAPAQVVMASSSPVAGIGFIDYPISASAQETAARLAQSKRNVPHYYLTVDLTMDALLEVRSTLNKSIGKDGEQLGVYELLLKAAAAAMKAVPSANASWMDSVVRVYDSVDINVVVGNGDALYTPVIRDAGRRGLKALSADLNAAVSSLDGKTELSEEFHAMGTFTVMNLGMYGVKSCAPIIREPQACALALGTLENRIVPNTEDPDQLYKEAVMMTATLSCDHRVVDGAVGAQWLSAFKSHVENPTTLLL